MASYGDLAFGTIKSENTIKGLEFPVKTTNTGGMFSRSFNSHCIRDGLLQLIMTQRGERPMRLDYGTSVRTSVFAPLNSNTVSNIRQSILTAISKYEPRVVIKTLEVTPNDAESSIAISLVFSVKGDVFFTDQISLVVNSAGVQVNG
tara:strand:+ start:413 stop:853 length:441 start_codon:yes stop_codon:yes gene_type:complete